MPHLGEEEWALSEDWSIDFGLQNGLLRKISREDMLTAAQGNVVATMSRGELQNFLSKIYELKAEVRLHKLKASEYFDLSTLKGRAGKDAEGVSRSQEPAGSLPDGS